MDLFAHRGFAEAYPENTLSALRTAARRVDTDSVLAGVELDVRRCKNGDIVVVHDERVDDLTDATGPVAEYTAAELADLSVEGSTAHIPTLPEALARIPPRIPLQIELKEYGLAADVLHLVGDRPAVRLTTFDPAVVEEVRWVNAACPLGYLFDSDTDVSDELAHAQETNCTSVHPHVDQCDETDVVKQAHDADLNVVAWGVAARTDVRTLLTNDADGCTVDHWELAAPVRDVTTQER